jgi:hypothetical protein
MAVVYAGSTPKYLIKVKDENGLILDPRDVAMVLAVNVFIYNAISGVIFAKFYWGTAPNPITGWTLMLTKDLGAGDVRLQLILSASQTQTAEGNSNKIQINVTVPDTDAPGGNRVIIKTGKFSDIVKAKS